MTGSLPPWQGTRGLEGRPDGDDWPLSESWFSEEEHAPDGWVALFGSWDPLEVEGMETDPPAPWGFDPGGASAGGVGRASGTGARQTETLSGVVKVVSRTGTGLILEELPEEWLNLSRFSEGVDLAGIGTGDVVEVEVEVGGNGKRYLRSLKVLDEGETDAE